MRKELLIVCGVALLVCACNKKPEPAPTQQEPAPTMEPMTTANDPYANPSYAPPSDAPPAYTGTDTYEPPMAEPAPADEPVRPNRKPAKAKSSGQGRTYVVQKGDTLSGISQKMYGTSTRWKKIWEANKARVPDANKLPVGVKLIIP